MIRGTWRLACTSIAVFSGLFSIIWGGMAVVIIPGGIVLAAIGILWKEKETDLYLLAAGQLIVYGAAYGSLIAAVVCEFCIFAAISGHERINLLAGVFIALGIMGGITQAIFHTGWWIAGMTAVCITLTISGYTREEALSRAMRRDSDE